MKLNNIDLNKLHVFHTVIKYSTYKAASEQLNITKSAISQSITSLEAQLGLQLFLRKGKKLIPSKSALDLYAQIDTYQTALLKTLASLKNNEQNIKGVVRIGAYLEFTKSQMTKPLKEFFILYPDVQVKLRFDSPTRLQSLLEDDHIDLSFSIFPVKGVKNIQSKKILKEELVLICPKGYTAKLSSPESIISQPLIEYFEQSQTVNKWLYCHFKKRYKKLPIKLFAASAEMVLESVKNGIGLGVVPHYLVDSDVQIVRPTENQLTDYIWLNQYKEQFSNPAHKAFSEFISQWFGVN